MLPIGDVNPTRRFPIMTYVLIGINVACFLYELSLGARVEELIATWGARSSDVSALLGGDLSLLPRVLLSSLVSMFLHGGWLHIGGNMLFLWIFGDNVEDNFGSLRFALFYVLCGYGAVLVQGLMTPTSPVPAIGASGAISGVLAAYLLLYPSYTVRALLFVFIFFTVVYVPAWLMIVLWFVLQLLSSWASLSDAETMSGGVAYGAHVGGFVVGFVLAFVFRRAQRPPRYVIYDRHTYW